MKKLVVLVALVALAGWARAETVVLKGGKRLDVQRFEQRGNYVIVQYAGGRLESYPMVAVDLAATREANGMTPAAPSGRDTGPHSPFFAAQAGRGSAAVAITDADVQHLVPEEEGEEGGAAAKAAPGDGSVVLLGYEKKQLEDGQFEITATVANNGTAPVQNITTKFRLLDREGKTIGEGTAGYAGQLAPGAQGALTATVAAAGDPTQVSFEFQWQTIKPVAKEQAEGGAEGATAATKPAAGVQPGEMQPPAGAPPLTQPPNPMALPPVTAPPANTAPQVPPPTPAGKG